MTKIRDITWPEEFIELKRIEESMVCGICYDYMETSVITPCSHNYCSLCIRKYLHYKTQCPACFHVFFEKDLYVNRSMDHLIQYYTQLREKLINIIQNRIIYSTVLQENEDIHSTPPIRPARNIQLPKSPKVIEIKESDSKSPSVSSSLATSSNYNASSPSTSKSIPSIAKMFNTPRRKEVIRQPMNINIKTVACPVCSVEISENNINVHLDACLKRETNQEIIKAQTFVSKRPPMPKLVLRVMKDAELRRKMKEFGLSTQGDRKTLENRFTRYSTIYNAECDKLEPRPTAELIKQCEAEEKQERKMDNFLVSATTRLQIERNAKEEAINEAQKKYREINKSNFDKLIEEVRLRRLEEKPDSDIVNSSKPSTSSGIERTLENISENDDVCTLTESRDHTFQDSDSDETCPLQHYINVNDSSASTSTMGSPIKKPQNIFINNTFQTNKLETYNETTVVSEEEIAGELTDEDVPASPILNKKSYHKRVRLSNVQLNKSNSSLSAIPQEINHELVLQDDRETAARNLCNSIINDFTFDAHTDESSNEFVDKLGSTNNKETKTNTKEMQGNNVTPFHQQDKVQNFLEKEDPKEHEHFSVLTKNRSSPIDEFSFDILNGDSSSEFINKSIIVTKESEENKILKNLHLSDVPLQKENDSTSANEDTQFSVNDETMNRPVRQRKPTTRYCEHNTVAENVKRKSATSYTSKQSRIVSPQKLTNTAPPDGSLKRRRGRPKMNCKDQSSDEPIQNPPKRPVRRRQVAPDRNLS